jgi:tetratricopeptide (TPR) repeat protein
VPHVRIATDIAKFQRADPPHRYLERAKALAPAHPELWYLCGVQEFADGQIDEAWRSWRRSIELSDDYLTDIVDQAVASSGPDELLQRLPQSRPVVWRLVAYHLYPQPDEQEKRRPFLEKALAIHGATEEPPSSSSLREKALVYDALGRSGEAIAAYEDALLEEPSEVGWRYELAGILHRHGRFDEARRHLVLVLGQQPGHAAAAKLLDIVAREQAAGARDKAVN